MCLNKPDMSSVIFIVGPTAIGKTEVSYLLARKIKGEVVSSDSMLIYRQVSIITSMPPAYMLGEVRHHFIGVISPEETHNVFDYCSRARERIANLVDKGTPVVVCGGTGLYIKAILDGIFEGAGRDCDLRRDLEEKAQKLGKQYLFEELRRIDPDTANKISPNDLKRIIRALEVYHKDGIPISQRKKEASGLYGKLPLRIFGLRMNRELLYKKINQRVDDMFKQGAVEEVHRLIKLKLSLTAEKIIGIKEIKGFLCGEYDEKTAREKIKKNTRNFAKRQITWFKKDRRIEWIDADKLSSEKIKEEIYQRMQQPLV